MTMRVRTLDCIVLLFLIIIFVWTSALFLQGLRDASQGDSSRYATEKEAAPVVAPYTVKSPRIANRPIDIVADPRANRSMHISMVVVVTQGTNGMDKYQRAINSQKCYGLTHGYPLHILSDDMYSSCQIHKDKFFRRHCTVERFMLERIRANDWIFVMDADIAIINPNILLESFINPAFDITLFDRFFNWEVAALSFIVRNSAVGRRFVRDFSAWEFRLPRASGHGSDNGALHPMLMELLAPGASKIKEVCYEIWNASSSSRDLFAMEACARMVIGDRIEFPEKSLRILPKGTAWVRDVYLLRSAWADDDFMFHAAKDDNFHEFDPVKDDLDSKSDYKLINWMPEDGGRAYVLPLIELLDLDKCLAGTAVWRLDGRLQISTERKVRVLRAFEFGVIRMRLGFVSTIAKIIEDKSGLKRGSN